MIEIVEHPSKRDIHRTDSYCCIEYEIQGITIKYYDNIYHLDIECKEHFIEKGVIQSTELEITNYSVFTCDCDDVNIKLIDSDLKDVFNIVI